MSPETLARVLHALHCRGTWKMAGLYDCAFDQSEWLRIADAAIAALTPAPAQGEWVRPDYGSHTCVSGIVRPYEGNLCAHPACWSPTTPPPTEVKLLAGDKLNRLDCGCWIRPCSREHAATPPPTKPERELVQALKKIERLAKRHVERVGLDGEKDQTLHRMHDVAVAALARRTK